MRPTFQSIEGIRFVYHGGTEPVVVPEIRKRLNAPDFGLGFYTTESEEQAVRCAKHVRLVRKTKDAVVTVYDISALNASHLKVKVFDSVSEEWFDAIITCRSGKDALSGYDVVIGPVANDNVYRTIRFFETGVYDKAEAMRRLLAERLFNQVVFKTDIALQALRYVSHGVVASEGGSA